MVAILIVYGGGVLKCQIHRAKLPIMTVFGIRLPSHYRTVFKFALKPTYFLSICIARTDKVYVLDIMEMLEILLIRCFGETRRATKNRV